MLRPSAEGTQVTTDLTHIAINFDQPVDAETVKRHVRVWYLRSGQTGRSQRELKDLVLEEGGRMARFRYDRPSRAQDGKYIVEIGDATDPDSSSAFTFIASSDYPS